MTLAYLTLYASSCSTCCLAIKLWFFNSSINAYKSSKFLEKCFICSTIVGTFSSCHASTTSNLESCDSTNILLKNIGGIFNKDRSHQEMFHKDVFHKARQKYNVLILNFTQTYKKIQPCRRAKKLKFFQIGVACKIKLLIGVCRLPHSLDSSP